MCCWRGWRSRSYYPHNTSYDWLSGPATHYINSSRHWQSIFHASYFVAPESGKMLSLISLHSLIWGNNLGVIKSYRGGFSSPGVLRIKISLFARRFWHPHPWCFFQYLGPCQKPGSAPVLKSPGKLCFEGLTTFTVIFELWDYIIFENAMYMCMSYLSISWRNDTLWAKQAALCPIKADILKLLRYISKDLSINCATAIRGHLIEMTLLECLNSREYVIQFYICGITHLSYQPVNTKQLQTWRRVKKQHIKGPCASPG